MDWIKVTPETMPPDMEPVLVMERQACWDDDKGYVFGKPFVACPYRYNKTKGIWEFRLSNRYAETQAGIWEEFYEEDWEKGKHITYWAPMPKPAED